MKKFIFILCWLFLPLLSYAAFIPLSAEQVFVFSVVKINRSTITLNWNITPGYYLYRDRFQVATINPAQLTLGTINWPNGIAKQDEIFGHYQVYENSLAVQVPVTELQGNQAQIKVLYQGCAKQGFCYPPITKIVQLNFADPAKTIITKASNVFQSETVNEEPQTNSQANVAGQQDESLQNKTNHWLVNKNWALIIAGFFGLGILLSFTPCVLPMIPILAGIIVGQGVISSRRAFVLSLTYVLAMAITYAIAGVFVGLAGSYIQAYLQNVWVLSLFSLLFVLLALSLFGFYELRLPASWQERLSTFSNRQTGGTYIGVAVMGCLSTLIVSPCVSAPLVGALGYITNTGNALLGGLALLMMGFGMGIPLLIVGTFGAKLLPKAGNWLSAVKAVFGVLLLGVAIWLIERFLPPEISMLLWAILVVFSAIYAGALNSVAATTSWGKFRQGFSLLLLVYGLALFVGGLMGNTDVLRPLALMSTASNRVVVPLAVQRIKTLSELETLLATAKSQNKPVFIDFYADWCIACKQMERSVFTDPAVLNALRPFMVVQADVTANDETAQALAKHFNVIAPPSMIFFNNNGHELTDWQIVGEIDAKTLIQQLQRVAGAE